MYSTKKRALPLWQYTCHVCAPFNEFKCKMLSLLRWQMVMRDSPHDFRHLTEIFPEDLLGSYTWLPVVEFSIVQGHDTM